MTGRQHRRDDKTSLSRAWYGRLRGSPITLRRIPMSCPPRATAWTTLIRTHLPHLTTPQAVGRAADLSRPSIILQACSSCITKIGHAAVIQYGQEEDYEHTTA